MEALAQRLHATLAKTGAEFGVAVPPRQPGDDPVEVLRVFDEALLAHNAPRIGIVLDELDAIFHQPVGSALRVTLKRLGGSMFHHLAIVGTVQRHTNERVHFRGGWTWLRLQSDLTWEDAVNYFCNLEGLQTGAVVGLTHPFVLPQYVSGDVMTWVGGRASYWAHLWDFLERRMSSPAGRPATPLVATATDLTEAIADVLSHDVDLARALVRTDGLTESEIRREDLFTVPEQLILAGMSANGRFGITVDSARAMAGGAGPGDDAIENLLQRDHLRLQGNQLVPAVRILGEFLVQNREQLFHLLKPDEVTTRLASLHGSAGPATA